MVSWRRNTKALQFHRGTLRAQKGSSRVDSGAWLLRQPEDESANRCRLCEKSSEVSRPPLASCRSLCSTAIALLLVILVRSLRHQGWRELAFLSLTLSHHFYAPSVAYGPNLSNFCRSCCNHERPTQPIRYAATTVFSTSTIRRKPFFIQITYGSQISYRTLRGAKNCIRTKTLNLTSTQSCPWSAGGAIPRRFIL